MQNPKIFRLILFVLLLMTFALGEVKAENYTIALPANDYRLSTVKDGHTIIEMDDFGAISIPGEPQLPAKTFMIALPPGAKVQAVHITGNGITALQGAYKIMPNKPSIRGALLESIDQARDLKSAQTEWRKNYNATFLSNAAYPNEVGRFLGQGQWRKYTYARVTFHPFQYHPKSGRLLFYSSCTVSIDYTLPTSGSEKWQQAQKMLHDNVLEDIISQWLINYEEAQAWYKPETPSLLRSTQSSMYDYVIIVENDQIKQVVAPLKQWKQKIGHSVAVVTLDSIYSAMSGHDEAEKIWNFLHQNYSIEGWGIRYVLLVGYIDVLPIRFLFPSDKAWAYASDYYYAKLSKSWDLDNDNRWGEFKDDQLDPAPDVIVGRIPHNNPKIIGNICSSIINFEKDIGGWKYNALLAMGMMDYNKSGMTDGGDLGEYLKKHVFDPQAWNYTTLYEKKGLGPSPYACTNPLSEQNFKNACGPQVQSVVNCVAHGGPGGMAGHVWYRDLNKDGICDYSKNKAINEFTYNWFSSINNVTPNFTSAVVFLCGCSTGPPCEVKSGSIKSSLQIVKTPKDNLGRRYMVHGAPAVIASTAGSDYCQNWKKPQDGHGQSLNFYFYDQLINNDKKVGDAFFDAMLQYANNHHLQRGIRVFNLLGDPALNLKGIDDRPGGTDVVIHDGWYQHFSADNSDTGDMYVAVITTTLQKAGEIKIYKSTDHGKSWSLWNTVTSRTGFYDVEVIVAEWGSDEFRDNRLLVFTAGADGTVQVHRFPLAGGAAQSVIIASEGGSTQFWGVSAARDPVPRKYNLYLTYSTQDPNKVQRTTVWRSFNNGITWDGKFTFNGYYLSNIDGGVNKHVYLVAKKDNSTQDIYFKRSTNAGANWENWIHLTPSDGARDHHWSEPIVAASTDPGAPTVWVAYPYYKTGDPNKGDIRYAFSRNAGKDWTTNLNLSGDEAFEGAMHMKGYKAGKSRWMNIAYIYDYAKPQIVWRWSSGTVPAKWSAPRIVNDFEAKRIIVDYLPRVIYSPGAPATGSGVAYGGNNKIYFSAPWLTGQIVAYRDETSGTLKFSAASENGITTIQFTIPENDRVSVMIHDAVGKLVRNIMLNQRMVAGSHAIQWDEHDDAGYPIPGGRYLCTIETSNAAFCKGLTLELAKTANPMNNSIPVDWVETGELERTFQVSSLLATSETKLYAAAVTSIDETRNEGAVFRSDNGGETWERMGGLEGCWSVSCLVQISENVLLAGGLAMFEDHPHGIIYLTENGAENWMPVLEFPDGVVTDIAKTFEGHLFAATAWNGLIFKSENDGFEWFPVAEFGENVHIYSVIQASNGMLYSGVELPDNNGQIMRSENGGETWSSSEGLNAVLAVYDVIEAHGKLYAGVRGEDMGWIYQCSLEGPPGWFRTTELPDLDIKAVHCLMEGSAGGVQSYLFAGTEMIQGPSFTKVYVRPAEAEHWEEFGGTIDLANSVYALTQTSNTVYAGTGFVYGNVYKCTLESVNIEKEDSEAIPTTFGLAQNYPNPFNPSTKINYQIAGDASPVQTVIRIYDILGKEVITLVDEQKCPGYYSVMWSGQNRLGYHVANGVYLIQMKAGDFSRTRRIVVLR